MKIPMEWLRSMVEIPCSAQEFADRMTMSGTKVESVEYPGHELKNITVGKVLSLTKHEKADKLWVCKVDIDSKVLQIVTGADNLYEGAFVPVAEDGAVLTGGKEIHSGELRGELSEGMLCSIEELGYDRNSYPEAPENGIYIFPEDMTDYLGQSAIGLMMLSGEIVDYELTSNRPDCYSVAGVAREAAATFGQRYVQGDYTVKAEGKGCADDFVEVSISNPGLCRRYIARVVTDIKIGPSPLWMRRRLTDSGVRPVNNIVDVTNYVMLELGQPMHAFDIDGIAKVNGKHRIIVRNAEESETIVTLDGVSRSLDSSMLLITDVEKAVAIAGIMGGEDSKVTGTASAVLFESASFDGTNVRLSSKKLGLRTDSSGKFEKGIDPNLTELAMNRAMSLIEQMGWGKVVPGSVDCYPSPVGNRTVAYSTGNINALLGINISENEMAEYLSRIGIRAENGTALIPSYRPDIELEADIVEEVGRLYGYDKIIPTLTSGSSTVGKKPRGQILTEKTRELWAAFGYNEAVSYAFESPKVFDKLGIDSGSSLRRTVTILNPQGEDFSIMRTQTLNSMLESLSTNYNRRNEEAMLFEICKVYLPKALPLTELPDEVNVLTLGAYGGVDFYDMKGCMEAYFNSLGVNVKYKPCERFGMHPGRTAEVLIDESNEHVGYFGDIHPRTLKNYDIEANALFGCFNLDMVYANARITPQYISLPRFPGMKRDISMAVKDGLSAAEIEEVIRESAGELLEDVRLFDVYRGENMEAGMKSVAFAIYFRSPERTLREEEVSEAMRNILGNLDKKMDIKLRA